MNGGDAPEAFGSPQASNSEKTMDRRTLLAGGLSLAALPFAAAATVPPWEEKRRRELLGDPRKLLRMLTDPAGLGRYQADNARILASGEKVDIVFLGDSITEAWKDKRPGFFKAGRVGRGISGQTTPQMLVRMVPDVVDLKPKAVHIMAGTNDIAGNTGPMTPEMTRDNVRAMAAIAKQNGIKLLLASIPPAASFPWREGLETARSIAETNAWLKSYARQIGATYVDYHSALADPAGAMKPGLAYDGVHPTEAGYDVMIKVIEPILARMFAT
jgi:lysophospholipase L1-like esterase